MQITDMVAKLIDLLEKSNIAESDVPIEDLNKLIFMQLDENQFLYSKERIYILKKEINVIFKAVDGDGILSCLKKLKLALMFFPNIDNQNIQQNIIKSSNRLTAEFNQLFHHYEQLIKMIRTNLQTPEYVSFKYRDTQNEEVKEILDYINKNKRVQIFNYDFLNNYNRDEIAVEYDEENDYPYALYTDKRIYYPKEWDKQKIIDWHWSVIYEQDSKSPHCYTNPDFAIEKGDVILDAGAGEGMFTISMIDKISKVYIVEADPIWMEPLQLTLKKYLDKVVFVNKYLSNNDSESEITLDSIIGDNRIDFLKMDIEGFELPALEGGTKVLKRELKCAICAYHGKSDGEKINKILTDNEFTTKYSLGYMYIQDDIETVIEAQLRRGIIYGKNKKL